MTCKFGECDDGTRGTGKCKFNSCEWLYSGDACDDSMSIIMALICASIGTFVTILFVSFQIARHLQSFDQSSKMAMEDKNSNGLMEWDDIESKEEVTYSSPLVLKFMKKKMEFITYQKGLKYTGENVFIKTIKKGGFSLSSGLKNELSEIRSLSHWNVEKLLGVILDPPNVSLVTDVAGMGSLFDILHKKHIPIMWDVKYSMLQDVSRGMAYLHDHASIVHGRLRSSNCLVHQGWLVKISDIGLHKIRSQERIAFTGERCKGKHSILKKRKNSTIISEEPGADWHSLLWTAPELLKKDVRSVNNIEFAKRPADVFSYGVIMSEVVSRRQPYAELDSMPLQHVIEMLGHQKSTIGSLNGDIGSLGFDKDSKFTGDGEEDNGLLRPSVEDDMLPCDPAERAIMKVLMDSCWNEDPEERPPFAYLIDALELVAPLKGSHKQKRSILLERETESLEQYIAHDTKQIFNEKRKQVDLRERIGLPFMAKPEVHQDVTLLYCRVANANEMMQECSPVQLVSAIDYLWKSFEAILSNRKFQVSELCVQGDGFLYGSGSTLTNCVRHPSQVANFGVAIINAAKTFRVSFKSDLRLLLRIGLHCGEIFTAGPIEGEAPRYILTGESLETVMELEKQGLPDKIHATKKTVNMLNSHDFQCIARASFRMKYSPKMLSWTPGLGFAKTYWVTDKNG